MSLGNLVAVVFGLAFGGALLMLSPAKAGAAMVGLAAAVTILRFPFWGLLLFALVATFMPYSTVNVGILSLIHISEPTRPVCSSRMPSSA